MSNFKKMRLVSDSKTNKIQSDLSNIYRHETYPELQRLNDLDLEIKEILNSNIDEVAKAKLYSQTLRKFLTYKQLHQELQQFDRNREIDVIKKLIKPKKKKSKKKSAETQTNIIKKSSSIIKTPKKVIKGNQESSQEASTSGTQTLIKKNTSKSTRIKKVPKEKSGYDTIVESSGDSEAFQDAWQQY